MTKTYQEIIEEKGMFIGLPVGVSMWPMIRNRVDTVKLVKIDRPLKKHDVILYIRKNGQYVLHRIIKVNNTAYTLCGDNQWQKEKGVTDNMIIAVMDGFFRKEKYVANNNFFYKTYYHIWALLRPFRKLFYYLKAGVKKVIRRKRLTK